MCFFKFKSAYFWEICFLFVKMRKLLMYSFQNYKHWYLSNTWEDKAVKGTVVNQASFQGGSLEVTLTVLFIL